MRDFWSAIPTPTDSPGNHRKEFECAPGRSAAQHEAATQRRESQRESKGNANATKDADTRALEKRLSDALGLAVSVDHRG